ncbi:transcriptional regulator, LuxR family [Kribbella flavida DSM 17836]|uniref:Transcriptional regulator, LuxR family n=1 Tax=Kribbella flavida (strain DSM 17836 / JCM 10339 / NBRC 14399) TaxID=479435 RepID=D2PYD3_KRIFD|nr:response regulator transcription factor [Kribbella flavida]ADB35501.1 transcriptional regulator, LuxR family [Kribbella flavida DSM 17836]
MIRVVLGHRGTLVRGALAAVLSRESDLDVLAALDRSDDVLAAVRLRPQVVVLDPQLPGKVGIEELCRRLTGRGVLVLVDHEAIAATSMALVKQAPRVGLIATDATTDQLVEAVRDVAKGLPVVDVRLAVAALRAGDNPLTDRECEVLRQVTTGATAQEIARTLSLSAGTVRNYLSRILTKTGARSRIEAIRKAQDAGWI